MGRSIGGVPEPLGPVESMEPLSLPVAPLLESRAWGLNPIEAAAGPLLTLLARLRSTSTHAAPASLRAQLLAYLRQFEERAQANGVVRNDVLLARYILCSALDEAVLSTPWGSAGDWSKQSLLITVHNEAWGGEKIFQLLDHCLQSPHERLHLMELLYLCLCLGFEGRYRVMNDGRSQLEALRERTSAAIRTARGEHERELSPRWRGVTIVWQGLSRGTAPWAGFAAALAFLLMLLLGLRMMLAPDAQAVFDRIHALGESTFQPFERAEKPKMIESPRLAGLLADDIKANRVSVQDTPGRSVVTLRGDQMFVSGSATVIDELQPLMQRIAQALRRVKGQVRVTGHSDNHPISSPRFPSNWALSQARASQVQQILMVQTGQPDRFTSEGRSDTEPVASNDNSAGRAKNRRVEITVMAEEVE
nr:DotU family type VI secretion system protein [Pseudomonas sp. BSw22131]